MTTNETTTQPETGPGRDRFPRSLWWLFGVIVVLRGLPFVWAQCMAFAPGEVLFPVGYNPPDTFAYVSLIRQASQHPTLFFDNPFTLDVQSGRMLLLFHSCLGLVCHVTGWDPFWVLDLSRIPLTLLFIYTFWRCSRLFLADPAERTAATWLVGLSGGFDILFNWGSALFPGIVQESIRWELGYLLGLSTFSSCNNPLWLVGLIGTLWALDRVLSPRGLATASDVIWTVPLLILLYATHSYSAIVALTVVVLRPVSAAIMGTPTADVWRQASLTGAALAAFTLLVGPMCWWQQQDAVYRATAASVWGSQIVSLFWYPVIFGVVGWFAVRGLIVWTRRDDPAGAPIWAWLASVMLLHHATVLNGYHFIFHLHLPVCLAAAGPLWQTYRRLQESPTPWVRPLLLVLLGFSSIAITVQSALDTRNFGAYCAPPRQLVERLRQIPPTNVLAPPVLGNIIPVFSAHRVHVGHWFMTPGYREKIAQYWGVMGHAKAAELATFLQTHRIGVVIGPEGNSTSIASATGPALGSDWQEVWHENAMAMWQRRAPW